MKLPRKILKEESNIKEKQMLNPKENKTLEIGLKNADTTVIMNNIIWKTKINSKNIIKEGDLKIMK